MIHPDYGRQFQARTEFRNGRFFNYTRCSALAPVQKQLGKKQDGSLLFCVSCHLIGPKCFTPLLRLSHIKKRIDHYFLAKILRFGSLIKKFTDIIMLFKNTKTQKFFFVFHCDISMIWVSIFILSLNANIELHLI